MTSPVPPTPPVFPAGYPPVDSDFDTWVQAPFSFLTSQLMLRAHQTVNQNYTGGTTSGSSTYINFDTIDEDPYNGWNAPNKRWLAPFPGWYAVTLFNSIATQNVSMRLSVSVSGGEQQWTTSSHNLPGSFLGGGCCTATVFCDGINDYIQGQCVVINGNASNDTSSRGRYPRMEILFASQ